MTLSDEACCQGNVARKLADGLHHNDRIALATHVSPRSIAT
jgi:hypothetical protein